jgi:hypothetical protein
MHDALIEQVCAITGWSREEFLARAINEYVREVNDARTP